jgi:hypothetical protein
MTIKNVFATVFVAGLLSLSACSSNDQSSSSGDPGSSSGGGGGDGGSGASSSGGATAESTKRGTVKVSKGNNTVVEYTSEGVEGNIDTDQMYFELNSPDTKQVLHMTIHALTPGTYPFAEQGEAGKAHILFLSEDKLPNATSDFPASWIPSSGTLTLEKATNSLAKGSWTAKGTPRDATEEYTVEGTFDVPLHVL